jgi:hypothetical protein
VSALEVNGQSLEQEVMTVDVSRRGAQLKGIRGKLVAGSPISLARLGNVEQFLIVWVGKEKTAKAGLIGVSAVDPGSSFWKDVMDTHLQAEVAGAREYSSKVVPAKSNVTVRAA